MGIAITAKRENSCFGRPGKGNDKGGRAMRRRAVPSRIPLPLGQPIRAPITRDRVAAGKALPIPQPFENPGPKISYHPATPLSSITACLTQRRKTLISACQLWPSPAKWQTLTREQERWGSRTCRTSQGRLSISQRNLTVPARRQADELAPVRIHELQG
jgi:hypothetical protein